jgi:hypothetical protein
MEDSDYVLDPKLLTFLDDLYFKQTTQRNGLPLHFGCSHEKIFYSFESIL